MRVLLTGATGLVGTQLGIELVRRGHSVVALSRDAKAAASKLPFPAQTISWPDVKQPPPAAALVDIDAVVHLAGESIAGKRWSTAQKQAIEASRVDSTNSLVRAFTKASVQPRVWLNASAIGYYGANRGDEILAEDSAAGTDFLADVCQKWEGALADALPQTRKILLRIGVVLSRHGGFLKQVLPLFRTGLGGPISDGKHWLSWIHLDDLVQMILTSISDPRYHGPINAVSPHPVTNADWTKAMGKALSRPVLMRAPSLGLKLAMGEMSALALASQRVVPTRATQLNFPFKYATMENALTDICSIYQDKAVNELMTQQWIAQPIEKVFLFFRDEMNLEALTPPWLNFEVLKKSTPTIQAGTLLDYRLKIHGIPAAWRTKIEAWQPPHCFIDTQLKGPYKLWHHTHSFEALGGGTLITDQVLYKLPLWPFGIVALPLVIKDLHGIFKFRRQTIAKIFA